MSGHVLHQERMSHTPCDGGTKEHVSAWIHLGAV